MRRRRASAAALAALALLTSACGDGSQDVPRTVDSSEPSPDIQGHRGARGLRPENTLPSFELALDLGVDTLELDLHLSVDNEIVVWHDPIVTDDKCVSGADMPIASTPAAELRSLRCDRNPDPGRFPEQAAPAEGLAGDDYGIITLRELFDFVDEYETSSQKTSAQRASAAEVRFNVETKRKPNDPGAIGDGFDGVEPGTFEIALVDLITERRLTDRVTIQSFDHRSLWATRSLSANIELSALTSRGVVPDFDELAARGVAVWSPDYRSVSARTLEAARAAGLEVIPWTVNDPRAIASLLELGVDGIISDRPDLAIDASS